MSQRLRTVQAGKGGGGKQHADETRNSFDKPAVSSQDEAEIKGQIKLCLAEPIGCVFSETRVISQSVTFCRHRTREHRVQAYICETDSPSLHIST